MELKRFIDAFQLVRLDVDRLHVQAVTQIITQAGWIMLCRNKYYINECLYFIGTHSRLSHYCEI